MHIEQLLPGLVLKLRNRLVTVVSRRVHEPTQASEPLDHRVYPGIDRARVRHVHEHLMEVRKTRVLAYLPTVRQLKVGDRHVPTGFVQLARDPRARCRGRRR